VVLAVGDSADAIVERIRQEAVALKIGDGMMQDSAVGPVIRQDTCDRVANYIERGIVDGAKVVLDGRFVAKRRDGGFFIGPTILDHVKPESSVAQNEIFGPLLAVIRVKDLEEAIRVANRSRFGNASSIFTQSGAAARMFRNRIEAGMCGVNVGVPAPMAFFPFAGWKQSFFGDLHATGKDGVKFYTETRVFIERW
jgi:malonate-semialdehyde dehydrogenase (acetylating)/methylmalonate-semialdehyde dehydrogenase